MNGVSLDNRPENLDWGTGSQNSIDRTAHGNAKFNRLLSDSDVEAIRHSRDARIILAMQYGISKGTIDDIRGVRTYRPLPEQPPRNIPIYTGRVPGDRLVISESYRITDVSPKGWALFDYIADGEHGGCQLTTAEFIKWNARKKPYAVTSGRFMYRSLVRLKALVVSVRVERVQEISKEDVFAEGVQLPVSQEGKALLEIGGKYSACNYWNEGDGFDKWCIANFASLWDSIYATPKKVKTNPYTAERELCYVSYPWENIRETEKLHSGLIHYIVGNPHVWANKFKLLTADGKEKSK